jgi:aspartate kinase
MILQNVSAEGLTDFTFTVHRNDYDQALSILKGIAKSLNATDAIGSEKIVKVSIVGVGMRSHAGVASRMFESLAKENINIQMISTSEIKISVVIDEKYLELAVRALHSTFEMDKPRTVED